MALNHIILIFTIIFTIIHLSSPFIIPQTTLNNKTRKKPKGRHECISRPPPLSQSLSSTPPNQPPPDDPEPFAVPGKTSALKDASDYTLNAALTEAQYLHSSRAVPGEGKLSDADCYRMQTEAKDMMERLDFEGAEETLKRVQEERKDRYIYHLPLSSFMSCIKSSTPPPLSISTTFYSTGKKCRRFSTPGSDEYIYGDAVGIMNSLSRSSSPPPPNETSPSQRDPLEFKETRPLIASVRTLFRATLISYQGTRDKSSPDPTSSSPWVTAIKTYVMLVMSECAYGKAVRGTGQLNCQLYYYYLSLYHTVLEGGWGGGKEGGKVWCRKAIEVERLGGGGGEVGRIGTNWAIVNGWYDEFCEDEEEEGEGGGEGGGESLEEIVERVMGGMRSMDLKEVCKETNVKQGKKEEMKKELQEWFVKKIKAESNIT
ncbi:hypothetical protein TrCOL_g1772 [Triparma columacea]|uniref:Uncharacterized protein n=1 Tax=Triparma columacea TaxID=722753 RepID=A0A9W7GBD6_9STRA|nr:hypothetical protein TrCOL_g1772 [Triparma columacea]